MSTDETNPQEKPEGVLVTEDEWKGKKETALYGLTKTPQKKGKLIPGYTSILLREDAGDILKAMTLKTPSRRIGVKELVTAFVLAGAGNADWNKAAMAKAIDIPAEDYAKEIAKAKAEAK